MTVDAVDEHQLRRCLELAELGRPGARPNPLVGAVLACGEEVLATGYHARWGDRHAERVALDAWGDRAVPSDATLYVSLEPCGHHGRQPPCAELLVERGVRRVVAACADPNPQTAGLGPRRLRESGVEFEWAGDAIATLAAAQNAGFVSRHMRGRPFTTYKWAMTRNRRVATGAAGRRWISGEVSRMKVQLMRAASGAIVVGAGTVLADDPRLTVRGAAAAGMFHPPLRVVIDRGLRTPVGAYVVCTAREVPTVLVCASDASRASEYALSAYGVEIWRAPADRPGKQLLWAWQQLGERGVNDVLLESGPTLANACWEAALIDALACFTAPFDASDDQPGFAADSPLLPALDGVPPVRSGDDLLTSVVVQPVAVPAPVD